MEGVARFLVLEDELHGTLLEDYPALVLGLRETFGGQGYRDIRQLD